MSESTASRIDRVGREQRREEKQRTTAAAVSSSNIVSSSPISSSSPVSSSTPQASDSVRAPNKEVDYLNINNLDEVTEVTQIQDSDITTGNVKSLSLQIRSNLPKYIKVEAGYIVYRSRN